MRSKYTLIFVVLLALGFDVLAFGVGRLSAAPGTLDSPGPPGSTLSYTLEDIYSRLNDGTAGSPSTWTEPATGPTVGTGHTLSETMAIAPEVDDTNGAIQGDVLAGKTFWGLTSGQWGLLTGTGSTATYPAPVPKTGQTTSYATGDDRDLEKGVAWPTPRFTDNGDGTVTDNLTGLIWLKNANCANATRNWATALTDVAQLNTDGTMNGNDCGDTSNGGSHQTDWRLPNVRELQSLVHYGVYSPAVPNTAGTARWAEGDPFTGVQSSPGSGYWSSTTVALDSSYAWGVTLFVGGVLGGGKASTTYVWPVRGGQ